MSSEFPVASEMHSEISFAKFGMACQSQMPSLYEAIFVMTKIASPMDSSRISYAEFDETNLTHSFIFVTFVKDVLFTSGKDTSISFQVPAVLLALLTLSNF